jgi:hypothetical protein
MPRPLYDRHPRFKKLASVSGDNLAPTHPDHPANFIIPGADVNPPPQPVRPAKAPKQAKAPKPSKLPKARKGK